MGPQVPISDRLELGPLLEPLRIKRGQALSDYLAVVSLDPVLDPVIYRRMFQLYLEFLAADANLSAAAEFYGAWDLYRRNPKWHKKPELPLSWVSDMSQWTISQTGPPVVDYPPDPPAPALGVPPTKIEGYPHLRQAALNDPREDGTIWQIDGENYVLKTFRMPVGSARYWVKLLRIELEK